jgi:hypothetical protein
MATANKVLQLTVRPVTALAYNGWAGLRPAAGDHMGVEALDASQGRASPARS